MKYWYDTEFIENGSTIDLISIGIVAEDGREYYAINGQCNFTSAGDWVRENVIIHLPPLYTVDVFGSKNHNLLYKSLYDIRKDVRAFIGDEESGWTTANGSQTLKPEFWAYYGAYDHVALCRLFGPMVRLPKGWPFYTNDLKQWCKQLGDPRLPEQSNDEHHALADARWNKAAWEFLFNVSLRRMEE